MKTDLSKQRLNYNTIAHLYDEPLRNHAVDSNLVAYLDENPQLAPTDLCILDAGCGTGKQLAANRVKFPGMFMVGLDLFMGMLHQAKERCSSVSWINGDIVSPPFPENCFHYITNQFSYPHVQHKNQMMRSLYRLLKPGGRFIMTNIEPWSMSTWLIYQYFPAAQTIDYVDFLPVETFKALMTDAGFSDIRVDHRHLKIEEDLRQFQAYASQRFRTSQFMAISDEAYNAGLRAISAELAQAGGTPIIKQSDVCLVTISGDKL